MSTTSSAIAVPDRQRDSSFVTTLGLALQSVSNRSECKVKSRLAGNVYSYALDSD